MKNFYLIPNSEKQGAYEYADRIRSYIDAHGGKVTVTDSIREGNGSYTYETPVPDNTEAIIALGGDGTIIQAARKLVDLEIPLIGINLGTLGFLAETDRDNIENCLDALLADDFFVEERMMISGAVYRNGELIAAGMGLNDIVLHAYGTTRAIRFEFLVNGEHLNTYFGDGMIIATPTGSTAYSLSAGGPIVMPSAEMILATPINSHSMIARSIVLPAEVEITLKIGGRQGEKSTLNFDSSIVYVQCGDEIRITRSRKKAGLIRLKKDSFIEALRTKLEI